MLGIASVHAGERKVFSRRKIGVRFLVAHEDVAGNGVCEAHAHNPAVTEVIARPLRILHPVHTEDRLDKPKIPLHPKHPERICWGCDKYCSADDLRCGNGTIRTQHPAELFGDDWADWELDASASEPQIVTVEQLISGSSSEAK